MGLIEKAPGLDDISNNLITLSWLQLKPHIKTVFIDSLTFGFIPYPGQASVDFLNQKTVWWYVTHNAVNLH